MPSWKHIHFFCLGVLLKKQVKPICRPDIIFATLGGWDWTTRARKDGFSHQVAYHLNGKKQYYRFVSTAIKDSVDLIELWPPNQAFPSLLPARSKEWTCGTLAGAVMRTTARCWTEPPPRSATKSVLSWKRLLGSAATHKHGLLARINSKLTSWP